MKDCHHSEPDRNGGNEGKGRGGRLRGGHLLHLGLMALCCLAPLLLVPVVRLSAGPPRAGLAGLLPFLCPILMIGMIPLMLRHGR